MSFPYQLNQLSADDFAKYQELQAQVLDSSNFQLFKQHLEIINNQFFLKVISQNLIMHNALGAYVITGNVHEYSYQNAMIEVAKNQFEIYRWHGINEDKIDVKKTRGNINWEKLINCMRQFGITPDDHIPLKGRWVNIYVATQNTGIWSRIDSISNRLLVHRIFKLASKIIQKL